MLSHQRNKIKNLMPTHKIQNQNKTLKYQNIIFYFKKFIFLTKASSKYIINFIFFFYTVNSLYFTGMSTKIYILNIVDGGNKSRQTKGINVFI